MLIYMHIFMESDGQGWEINKEPGAAKNLSEFEDYGMKIDAAEGFSEVWQIVKDTVRDYLGEDRIGMLLFLDDLPLRLGAYHPLGTNNIVLNRTLLEIVEATTKTKEPVNAFVYSLLVHEYLHALGYVSEAEVRNLVYEISRECFGEDHIVTRLAMESPWSLLKGIPLNGIETQSQSLEVVKDFEKPKQRYIV